MKVLHVGWGFKPWWGGGYIEYLENLMFKQIRRGYDVGYFCSGRCYAGVRSNTAFKWNYNKLKIFEVVNSSLIDSINNCVKTRADLCSEEIENLFMQALKEFKPDIVHFHHFLGIPTSLAEIPKRDFHIPSIATMHDYYLLCPSINLFDYKNKICTEKTDFKKCFDCFQCNPVYFNAARMKSIHQITHPKLYRLYSFFKRKFVRDLYLRERMDIEAPDTHYFKKRREVNLSRLRQLEAVIVPSQKAADIFFELSNGTINAKIVPYALPHLERIKHREIKSIVSPVKFAALNVFGNKIKGGKLLIGAVRILNEMQLSEKFELHSWGPLSEEFKEILKYKNIYYHGSYSIDRLSRILSGIDVGIFPSLCIETYGIVALEFLAKGIPVITNSKVGASDIIKEKNLGWINDSFTEGELSEIMLSLIRNPRQIIDMNKKILNARSAVIKTIDEHFDEIDAIYKNCIKDAALHYLEMTQNIS